MSEIGAETQDNNLRVEQTQKAVGLYKEVREEAKKRNLRVWNYNSYTQLAVLSAFNDGNVSDTLDRYEIARTEGEKQDVSGAEIQNDDAYIGIAMAGIILSGEKSTK